MGVPLIPGRAVSRAWWIRPTDGRHVSNGLRRWMLISGAAVALGAVVVGVVVGAIPAPAAFAVACSIPAAVIDVEQHRLPDAWLIAAATAFLGVLAVTSVVGSSTDGVADVGIVGGMATMALPILALHLVSPAAMGFGDVKAAIVLGAALGTVDWRLGAVALCIASLSAAVVGLTARTRTVAFGPFLVLGALVALLAHDRIAEVIFTGGVR